VFFLDYDECHPAKIVHIPDCGPNARCVNLNMTYVCACNEGFENDGSECVSKYRQIDKETHSTTLRTYWPDLYQRRIIRLDELGQRKDSSSHNSSVYKHGRVDGSSVKTDYRCNASVQTNLLA
jgi:hypothetical protein